MDLSITKITKGRKCTQQVLFLLFLFPYKCVTHRHEPKISYDEQEANM